MHADSVMILMIFNTLENRVVCVCNAKGTYLNALLYKFLCIKFEGEQVKIMCKINPKYTKCVIKKRGKNVLYLALNKALHRCVQSAQLWCKLLVGTLLDIDFKFNPYDLYAVNKEIKRS